MDLSATGGGLRFNGGSLVHTPDADGTKEPVETAIYSLSADMSWEIDFFGRIRRATEAQKALFLGTQEARRATVLTLVADVARAYFELRAFDLQLEIARRTLASRREYLELARDRFEGGLTPEVDLAQAEAELLRIEVVTYDIERQIRQAENEISILIGRNPGPVLRGRAVTEQKRPAAVPAGLPSQLLDRHPDVRVAELSLASATANIGPRPCSSPHRSHRLLRLHEHEFDTWFDGPSKAWNILGNLLQPIFNAGKNRRRVEITESQQRQTLYEYERTILQAFRETEDALVAYQKTGEQRGVQANRVRAERKVLELAELRYRGGVAAYLEVLDAQRSLFGAEIDETQTITANLVSLVQLYKALGGGWPPATNTPPDPSGP